MPSTRCLFAVLLPLLLVALAAAAAPPAEYGRVELVRDAWGTAHIDADTEAGALYGLGYATAEERGFQMYYLLRIMQGRLSEVVGEVRRDKGYPASSVDADALMRTFGFARAADEVVRHLDAESLALLEAYSLGVNDHFAENAADEHPLFEKTGLAREPWNPAACLLSWWHLAQFFSKDGLNDFSSLEAPQINRPSMPTVPPDDDAAVVRREDVPDAWVAEVDAFLDAHGLRPEPATGPDTPDPKFSHAWVIGGERTTTGAAVLVSDPQTPVWNPSLFQEFHIRCASFNVRGMGVAGSPVILIGFNEDVAWGMTALGADQADLVLLKTGPAHPNAYQVDGEWLDMRVWEETVRVKDGDSRAVTLRETIFGPVVTDWIRQPAAGAELALQRVPLVERDRETIQAAWGMFRADSCQSFAEALPQWRFPSANCVFGDSQGNIGYWSLGAIPIRSALSRQAGRTAQDGSTRAGVWQGMIPYDILPHVINPKRGYLVTANHRTIQSFYRVPSGVMTGASGDTDRGLAIKERIQAHLAENGVFAPEEVLAIQNDCVNVWKREIARIGYAMFKQEDERLSPNARNALIHLRPWWDAGAAMDTSVPGTELAERMNTIFRGGVHAIVAQYGGGISGLARFAKATRARYEGNPDAKVTADEAAFADAVLAGAWDRCTKAYPGVSPSEWHRMAIGAATKEKLPYFRSLDGWPGLDPALDMPLPRLRTRDGSTILSQRAQAYTQFVPLHDTDAALAILPPGASDRPNDPARFSTYAGWALGELHPAPLSREAVKQIMVSSKRLDEAEAPAPAAPVQRRPQAERKPLPGEVPDDATLQSAIRYLNRQERTEAEVTAKVAELRSYVEGNAALKDQLAQGLVRFIHIMRESQAGRTPFPYGTPATLKAMEAFHTELTSE